MKAFYKPLLLLFLLFFSGAAMAQEVKVSAVLDSSRIRIGEQVKLDLYVTYNANLKNIKIQWPSLGDTLTGKIEVVSVSPIDTTFPDKSNSAKIFQHQQIIVSAYDSGYFAIPPFKFVVNDDSTNALYTENFLLEVHTVPTDTSITKIKDIKQPFDEKFNWRWYKNYIYAGIGLLLLIIAVILITRYYTRKQMQVVMEPEKPKIPAHITALATLERIKEEQVWKEGYVKEYYSSISDAVRLYIEDRFNVNALESTTDEIMKAFRSQVVDPVSKEKLQQLLSLSDLVKFAKQFPIETEHVFTLQNAFDFVNGTKREEEITIEPAGTQPAMSNAPIRPQQETVQNPMPSADAYKRSESKASLRDEAGTAGAAMVKPEKKQRIIKIVVGVASMLLVYFLMETFVFNRSQDYEEVMQSMANGMNRACPIMLDKDTRFDSASVPGGKVFQYNYTLVNITSGQIDINALRQNIEGSLIEQVKANEQLKGLRENGIILKYAYRDKTGQELLVITVGPQQYNTAS
jgi:hypothetical protein